MRISTMLTGALLAAALAAPLSGCAEVGELPDGVQGAVERAGEVGGDLIDRGRDLAEQGQQWWNESGSAMLDDVTDALESVLGDVDPAQVQQAMGELCTLIQSDAGRRVVETRAAELVEQATGVQPTDEQVDAVVDIAVAACGG